MMKWLSGQWMLPPRGSEFAGEVDVVYLALIWLNTLLGIFLTPLLTGIPLSWLLDWRKRRKGELEQAPETDRYQG